ncbi:replication initiation factor domain-containing protein [Leuconostoc mesenteroides]|uniref:replication initiation factor domain-containing protein n=1 Tax=Leuconostoc mesenteroides TaxID=1245 RepID=UPI001CC17897|nr:replication initiation factor domain-containing protein [Leuconostoc mesenteroides]MBZ1516703.1 replication initiation factor domain-containing protein [Leuconostoc mesenteroides]
MSENYASLNFDQMTGCDLVQFRIHYHLTQSQMASFLMISRRTYGRMEMSGDSLMTVLNADQRYVLKTYVGSQGLSLWLDYLGMSFKMRTPETLIKLFFDNRLDLFVKRDSGRYGYNVAYSFGGLSYITIYGKRDSPESFIDFSGSGIRLMEMLLIGQGLVWSHFINIALANGGKATRMDFAFNDMSRMFEIPELYQKLMTDEYTQKFKSDPQYYADGKNGGSTIYFGSRSSEVFFRFYEKDKEQAKKHFVEPEAIPVKNRYEIELKQKRAQTMAEHVANGKDIASELLAYLRDYLQFYNQPVVGLDKKEIAKLDQWQPWVVFLEQASIVDFQAEPKEVSMDRSLAWFINQVAPTLKGLIEYYGQEKIDEILDDTELSQRQKKLLSVAEKVNLPF